MYLATNNIKIALFFISFFTFQFSFANTPYHGATQGQFAVSPSGAATYTIPIEVPPGINGMQPNLALTYNSQAGNGLLGVGWNLSGLSAITRCPKTYAQDGVLAGIKLDTTDRYCLDGQRLVPADGNYGNYGANGKQYRTEIDSYAKIVSYGSSGSGPSYFKVWDRSGRVIEFGNSQDSKGNVTVVATGAKPIYRWAINKVSDTSNNTMVFKYNKTEADGYQSISSIEYLDAENTGSYQAKVQFSYSNTRDDVSAKYAAGAKFALNKVLNSLKTSYRGSVVSEFSLQYGNESLNGFSRIESIKHCGANICKEPIVLSYSDGTAGYSSASSLYWSNSKTADAPIGFVDLDGNGTADFYGWAGSGTVYLNLSNVLDGFNSRQSLYWSNNKNGDSPIGFADIDGDGDSDFYGWAGSGNVYIKFSNGDGTFGSAKSLYWSNNKSGDSPIGFADINGDGRADFYGWAGNGNVYIRFSNGDGTFSTDKPLYWSNYKSGDSPIGFADINGDGMADFYGWAGNGNVYIRFSNGDGTFSTDKPLYWSNNKSGDSPIGFADINGDGMADFYGWAGSGYVYYNLSRGDGTFSERKSIYWSNWKSGDSPIGFSDLNGDGMADFYGWAGSGYVYYNLAKADGTFGARGSLYWSNDKSGADSPIGFADINGDGLSDFYGWAKNGNVYVKYKQGPHPNLLSRSFK